MEKASIYLSSNVEEVTREEIPGCLRIDLVKAYDRYLGLAFGSGEK